MGEVKYKSLPGAILGIIGAVFAIIAAVSLGLCAEIIDGVTEAAGSGTNYTWMPYALGIGGGVFALIGAILDFKNNIIGGILQALGVVPLIVLCIVFTWSILLIIAIIIVGIGAILSFVVKKAIS